MAEIAVEHWTPTWAWEASDYDARMAVLAGFKRQILHSDIQEVDIDLVKEIILTAGDTACGPDRIPFSVYKSLVDTAAPVLL
jgi:hypothetical protein